MKTEKQRMNEDYSKIFNRLEKEFRKEQKSGRLELRRERLQKLKQWIKANDERIKSAMLSDLAKHAAETDLTEIKPVLIEVEEALKNLDNWAASQSIKIPLRHTGSSAKTLAEPKGVVLIISPWNFPFNLAVGPMVSALAAGCKIILKPSEWSEHCSNLLHEMVHEILEDSVQVICGNADTAKALLKLPFAHVFFTGSVDVGKQVMKAAAENLSSVTLELGGQNPAIIHESATLEDAAEKLVWAKCMNSGQSCMAPNTIFLPLNLKAEFIRLAKASYYKFYGKSPLIQNADFGRIISPVHANRLAELINEAAQKGANVFTADRPEPDNKFIPFTMLWNVPADSKVLKEEIFGPVMTIQTYDDPDRLTDLLWPGKPLATYVFANDKEFAEKILQATASGTACVNDTTLPFVYPGLPFGGIQQSGIGKAHGHAGFQAFTNYRAVVYQRTGITPLKFIYPPFNRISKGMVDLFVKWL